MKEGTRYASSFKKAYSKLKQAVGKPAIPEADDPVRRLAIAILGVECGEEAAERAIERAFTIMLDWNELRVSNPAEVHRALGGTVSLAECEQLVLALRAIYLRENKVSLDRLKALGRRDARQYLETLDGVNAFASASVLLWSLGGHAVPVNDRLLTALRDAGLVHPEADRAEVQAFLERHVSASEAKETCLVLQSLGNTAKKRTASAAKSHKAVKSSRKRRLSK